MKNLSLIVAIGKNNEIGKDNKLLWHIPEDLDFFKKNTIGKTILMGSNTFYSLPKLLPNRHHIVLTSGNHKFPNEVEVFYDFYELLNRVENSDEEIVVIGGAMIYREFIEFVDTMFVTEIDKIYEDADSFFPKIDKNIWRGKILSKHIHDDLKYSHVKYTRR